MPLVMPRLLMPLSLRYTSVVSLFGLLSVLNTCRHYLDSQNYISSYTPSNYPCDMGRIDEIKERIDYDYFEEFFPEKLPFLDILCVCILELYDETFACDRKLLNRINGSTVLGFFDHIKGKDYSNVRNMRGYFKKMLLEYLRAEVLLVATANV